jgi:tRNA G18 (ribose-2'-O)-methylase SpoU
VIHRTAGGDPRLGPYSRVGDPHWLLEQGLFVAEGRLVVERLLAVPRFDVQSVLVTPSALQAMLPILADASCDVLVCDPQVLRTVTGFNFHRGCLALACRPAPLPVEGLLSAHRVLALEHVGNPDNIGGIFRTAAALGADGVVLDPRSGDPFYRKAIRTSMGSTLRVPWIRLQEWPGGLEAYRRAGFTFVALTPDPSASPLDRFSRQVAAGTRLLLFFGAEGAGLSGTLRDLADERVRIPVEPAVDSLNIVVAAGIVLDRLR